MSELKQDYNHDHHLHNYHQKQFKKKTGWVVILTALTMVVEIIYGLTSESMALLADGIHMGSHVLAIGLSFLAYVFVKKAQQSKSFTGDSHKILSLSGYTSGLILLIFALFILIEAIQRFIQPVIIDYQEAIIVACIGLVVNIASAFLLQHDHKHSDHNIRAAYLHVIADTMTSFSAIVGLIAAKIWGISYIDTIAAVISSLVIIRWAIGLLKVSGKVLVT